MSKPSELISDPPPGVETPLRGVFVLPVHRGRRSQALVVGLLSGITALAMVACSSAQPGTAVSPTPERASTPATGVKIAGKQKWISGAAGEGVDDGALARWRGRKVGIAATWNEEFDAQTEYWTLQPGAEYGAWTGDLDIAVGSIYQDRGETWANAARGDYDARWAASLEALRTAWAGRPGTLYIRFAHEFNGDWFEWQVHRSEIRDFIKSWRRYRALQKSILPGAKLVFCPNDGTVRVDGYDWRKAFPGKKHVDVMSVDSFNQWPFAQTKAEFTAKIMRKDVFGAPLGIERHRRYAKSLGKPFAVSEWSSNASFGDSPVYVRQFYKWVSANAGRGPGKVRYEILFNMSEDAYGVFQMYPSTQMPKAARAYRKMF